MKHQSEIHIGKIIQTQLKADQRNADWLAHKIGCSRNNVYKILSKPSLDSDLILRISIVMQYNFFQYYTVQFLNGIKSRIGNE